MQVVDQRQQTIQLPAIPKRIVSLVPSQTELLVDLGLEDSLVGVTKFCVHPADLRSKKVIVGGTKNYRMEIIEELKPDLIIGNKEENDKEGIEQLKKKYKVWMSDIYTMQDNLNMITAIGEMLHVQQEARRMVNQLTQDFKRPLPVKGSAVYLIWKDPYMLVGKNTFIDEMLTAAGYENLIIDERYPERTIAELKHLNPKYVLLSSEPYPFKEVHKREFELALPQATIQIVDGEKFSWYGSRLLQTMDYFKTLK